MPARTGREYLEMAPWLSLAPGAAIFATTLSLNFLGDAVRDILDPRLRMWCRDVRDIDDCHLRAIPEPSPQGINFQVAPARWRQPISAGHQLPVIVVTVPPA